MLVQQTDMHGQLNLCLMAAEMFRAPMETSLPFPQASFIPGLSRRVQCPELPGAPPNVDRVPLSQEASDFPAERA